MVGVSVTVEVCVGAGVRVCVGVRVTVGVCVAVLVAVAVGVEVGRTKEVREGSGVEVGLRPAGVAVSAGVGDEYPGRTRRVAVDVGTKTVGMGVAGGKKL